MDQEEDFKDQQALELDREMLYCSGKKGGERKFQSLVSTQSKTTSIGNIVKKRGRIVMSGWDVRFDAMSSPINIITYVINGTVILLGKIS